MLDESILTASLSVEDQTIADLPPSRDLIEAFYGLHTPCDLHDTHHSNHLPSLHHIGCWHYLLPTLGTVQRNVNAIVGPAPPAVLDEDTVVPFCHGLLNLSNTCYLNTIIQWLSYCVPLRTLLLEEARLCPSGIIAQSGLAELILHLHYGKFRAASTEALVSFLHIDPRVQQDAQEFLNLLISWIEGSVTLPQSRARLHQTLKGTVLYCRQCDACGFQALKAEPYFFLSVPASSCLLTSIEKMSEEKIHGFSCGNCKHPSTVATSRMRLAQLPEVLIFHISRFSYDTKSATRLKIDINLHFPTKISLDQLPMETKAVSPPPPAAAAAAASLHVDPHADPLSASEIRTTLTAAAAPEYYFELSGVVSHLGPTPESGHYVYHGQVGSDWYHMDDAEVKKMARKYSGESSSSRDAYLLIYQRKPIVLGSKKRSSGDHQQGDVQDDDSSTTTTTVIDVDEVDLLHHPRLDEFRHESRSQLEQLHETMRQQAIRWQEQYDEAFQQVTAFHDLVKSCEQRSDQATTTAAVVGKTRGRPSAASRAAAAAAAVRSVTPPPQQQEGGTCLVLAETSWLQKGPQILRREPNAVVEIGDVVATSRRSRISTSEGDTPNDSIIGEDWGGGGASAVRYCPHGKVALGSASVSAVRAMTQSQWEHWNRLLLTTTPQHNGTKNDPPPARSAEHGLCSLCVQHAAERLGALQQLWKVDREICRSISVTRSAAKTKGPQPTTSHAEVVDVDGEDVVLPPNHHAECGNAPDDVLVSVEAVTAWQSVVPPTVREVLDQEQTGLSDSCSSALSVGLPPLVQRNGEPYDFVEDVLCPHRLRAPLSAARWIPHRVAEYLTTARGVLFSRMLTRQEVEASEASGAASDGGICTMCTQQGVQDISARHALKLRKMEEAKQCPPLREEDNRTAWRRDIAAYTKRHRQQWQAQQNELAEAAKKAQQEAQLKTAGVVLHKNRTVQAPTVRKAEELTEADPQSPRRPSAQGTTTPHSTAAPFLTQSNIAMAEDSQPALEPNYNNREDDEAAARNENDAPVCPPRRVVYHAIPSSWVRLWREWYKDATFTVPPPPSVVDSQALLCPHGELPFPIRALNPNEYAAAPGKPLYGGWTEPPLLIFTEKDFDKLREWYGAPTVDIQFVELDDKRLLVPGSCSICLASLRAAEDAATPQHVLVSINCKVRKSKKQFHEFTETLPDVLLSTTIGQLSERLVARLFETQGLLLENVANLQITKKAQKGPVAQPVLASEVPLSSLLPNSNSPPPTSVTLHAMYPDVVQKIEGHEALFQSNDGCTPSGGRSSANAFEATRLQAQAPVSQLPQEIDEVACVACTFLNDKRSRECAICGTPLPK